MFNAILAIYILFLPLIISPATVSYRPEVYPEASVLTTQPPVPAALRSIENRLLENPNGALNKITAWQNGERNAYGRYHQFLWTHPNAPESAVDLLYLDFKPSDGRVNHRNVFTAQAINTRQEVRWQINVYDAPCGHGYEMVLEANVDDTVWRKVFNHPVTPNCESHRAIDWTGIIRTGAVVTP